MSLKLNNQAKGGGGVKQDTIEIGTYPARLVRVIDLGLQARKPYKGQEKPPAYMVSLTYELLDVFMLDAEGNEDETKPRWISEDIAIHHPSADLAISTKRAKALDPENDQGYDLSAMVGAPCMITVVHKESKGKTYANIGNVTTMRAKDAAKAPELVNEPLVFDLDQPTLEKFNEVPQWLQEKIKNNLEYKGSKLAELLGEDNDDDDRNLRPGDVEEEGEAW